MKPPPTEGPDTLPPLYATWMREALQGPIPHETEATCNDCVMLAKGGCEAPQGSGFFFDPHTKCCTYIPELPNFLVGRILADRDAASARGRATLEKRLVEGVAVTPLGIGRSPTFRLVYQHSADLAAFGRNRALRCPHYLEEEGGQCGIWRHRRSTCATWFCKHVRGAVGASFWRAMHELLSAAEEGLTRWCVLELDIGPGALRRLFRPAGGDPMAPGRPIEEGGVDGVADPAIYRELWGSWAGRERDFYAECARRMNALAWKDVAAICGSEVKTREALARQAYSRLISEEPPPALEVGPVKIVRMGGENCRVSSYSAIDLLDIPKPLLDVLHHFDGRPTEEAVRAIAEEEGIDLDEALVRKLADFRILVPSAPPVTTSS